VRDRRSLDILPVKKEAKLSASEVPGEVGSGEEDLRCRSLLTVCQRRLGLSACAQTLYALCVLRKHGLCDDSRHDIFRAVAVAKLMYAYPHTNPTQRHAKVIFSAHLWQLGTARKSADRSVSIVNKENNARRHLRVGWLNVRSLASKTVAVHEALGSHNKRPRRARYFRESEDYGITGVRLSVCLFVCMSGCLSVCYHDN